MQDELEKSIGKKILLIEPVPYNLKELKERVKKFPEVIIEPTAISDKDEIIPFYYIKRSSIEKLKKHWASGIGSFEKDHILNHKNKRFKVSEEDIEEIKIQCLSPQSLIKKYSIEKVEKLMIDVEGSEYKILKSIDYKKVRINNIIFEKKLLIQNGILIIHRHKKDDIKISNKLNILEDRSYGISKILFGN